ncbi:MAG: alpha-amylase family glycosyl hydrolase [Acidobacteriota bacterium]
MRIYEINTRLHCQSFDQITSTELEQIARLGFDTLWLMGVWEISRGALRISKITADDFEGSPYAVPEYKFNRALGGKKKFRDLVTRAHSAGLRVIVDFVSNHMAIDSPWIKEDPELFIRSNPHARNQQTGEYFLHPSGEVIAFGRDPFYPPWHDTAQLDFTNEKLRSRQTDALRWISRQADGVRCDMAMLVLRDYFREQWYPLLPEQWFDEQMPAEFWSEAIAAVKSERPDFVFIAETYWDKEQQLIDLGFDLAYEKKLYDALVARNAEMVNQRLAAIRGDFKSALCFIENHDEPRAASLFNREDNLAAAALILSLPSSALIHEGQMEGKREKLPVQRIKPLMNEPVDDLLKRGYERILAATSQEVFRDGTFELFDSRVWGAVAFVRRNSTRAVAYLAQISEAWHRFKDASFDISHLAGMIGASERIKVINLINSASIIVEKSGEGFCFRPDRLSVGEETQFCIIETLVA